jgi:hypothetical protein
MHWKFNTMINPFSARTQPQNVKMRVPGMAGYGEFQSSSNIHELFRHLY